MRCLSYAIIALCLGVLGCSSSKEAAPEQRDRFETAAEYSARHGGQALLIWANGEFIVEDYRDGFTEDTWRPIEEASKMFAGLIAIAAAGDGDLRMDAPVALTISEWNDEPEKAGITVTQLLKMVSGLETDVDRAPTYAEAIEKPLIHKHGEEFRYGSTGAHVFGKLLRREFDGENPSAYLKRRVLNPIGVPGARWLVTDNDDIRLADGSHVTPGEWIRVGRLLLQNGEWEGETILSGVDALFETTTAGPAYGLGFWVNAEVDPNAAFFRHLPRHIVPDGPGGIIYAEGPSDLLMAAGRSDQRLYVIPSENTVVARFGASDGRWVDAEFLARLLDGQEYTVSSGGR